MHAIKYVGALPLLVLFQALAGDPTEEAIPAIVLNHEIIRLFDGTRKIDCFKIMRLERGIKELRDGDKDAQGLIMHQGQKHTLKGLAELEKAFSQVVPKKTEKQRVKAFKEGYDNSISLVHALLRPYLDEIKECFAPQVSIRQMYCTLLEFWASTRKLKTVLIQCSRYSFDDPESLLRKLAPTLAKLDELMYHISLFLRDMRISSQESFKQFLVALGDQSTEELLV